MRHKTVRLMASVGLGLSFIAAAGCGGENGDDDRTPEEVVETLYDALASGDGEGACELLTEAARARAESGAGVSCAEGFSHPEGDADSEAFANAEVNGSSEESDDAATVRATRADTSDTFQLVVEDGEWKIDVIRFGSNPGDTVGGLFDAYAGSAGQERGSEDEPKGLPGAIRAAVQAANEEVSPATGEYSAAGKAKLSEADAAWQRLLAMEPDPDPSLAALMVQVYGPTGLDKPADALNAAELVAEASPTAQAYVQVVQFAARSGEDATADEAAEKAVELAPAGQRGTVRALVAQAKRGE